MIAKKELKEDSGMRISHTAQIVGNIGGAGIEKKKKKKKSAGEIRVEDKTLETSQEKKKGRKLRDKKGNKSGIARRDTEGFNAIHVNEVEDTISKSLDVVEPNEEKLPKPRKKKMKNVESTNHFEELCKKSNASEQCNDSKPEDQISNCGGINKGDPDDEVYQMSSGDEDYSKGMKKWIAQYYESRPGLKVLEERIDDFIMAHEAKEEQARAERLAQAAEGGWTVVVHQKGCKKTTDAESGIAVGAVAQAAVLDKLGKKKKREVGLSFYQFHKREAHRNEIMMLQSKFEQDKKRIQQMRAARNFLPY